MPVPMPASGGADTRREVREAVLVAVVLTLLGLALGALWAWLAPRVPLISDGKVVILQNTEGEEAIGADGTFALLAAGLGALSAAVMFVLRRSGGLPLVLALTVGGLLGSFLAWRSGMWLGPNQDVVAQARAVGEGVIFDAPLRLGAKGALLAWPFAAMVVQLVLTGVFAPRDAPPEPITPHWPETLAGHRRPGG